MVLTYSTMLSLGTKAPEFALKDVVSGKEISNATFADKKLMLVMFMCKHCPYVVHIETALAQFSADYQSKDIGIVGISSNDAENYQEDSPEKLKEYAERLNFKFPLLFDETQDVAKRYTAACTPDFFLFDSERKLVYRGQFDESRRGNTEPIDGKDLRAAVDAALAGKPVPEEQKPSTGCNIKWKPGNEPPYFGVQ
ncbi:MAG: thioredoxin family protein [Candidatus Melainabacteria bacterium]|nr:thioredoxin family protein [Candidatus Melainabacteria bacterium]